MPYSYAKLKGAITEVFGTAYAFAEAMNVSQHTMSAKLNSKVPWTQPEMSKACELLGIPKENIHLYFF